ncbi:DUF4270 domain-containing protein [Flavobacterium sp.]|uniref:DUF4270 domain-containing protein n=1 Tax=Flavobacterium sp. TaxID=239 RepID=UPI003752C18A
MMNTTFLRKLTIVLVAIFFASCDKDYNTLGSNIVGNDDFTITPELFSVKAYNQKVSAVETSNMAYNQLGILVNPNTVLGKITANFVTQLSLVTEKPTFKNKYSIEIDSVVLTVPYYSTKISTDANGIGTYQLNSIYTTNTSTTTPKIYDPINLKVFRNGVYLRDSDPVTFGAQKHFSDEDANFNANIASPVLNDAVAANENTAFVPDTREYKKYKVDTDNNVLVIPKVVESHNSPRMRLHLSKSYFNTNIILAPVADLDNNNAFKSYFKGLYFQVTESVAGKGTSMGLDFAKGDVTIYYKQDKVDVPGSTSTTPSTSREMASLTLKMSRNTVGLFKNTDEGTEYSDAMVNTPQTEDKNLYLKGGQGSMAFLELFTSDELTNLKSKNVLVNEASLTFTVDKSKMTSNYDKPQRIYIFNADTNVPLYDYYLDNTVNITDESLNKIVHGGIIETVGTGITAKDKYKIRITDHINNILKETTGVTKNVRLGVVVTGNINALSFGVLNPVEVAAPSFTDANKKMNKFPVSSIISPLGTVLYGSNYLSTDVNYDDRIKFQIYYTKSN